MHGSQITGREIRKKTLYTCIWITKQLNTMDEPLRCNMYEFWSIVFSCKPHCVHWSYFVIFFFCSSIWFDSESFTCCVVVPRSQKSGQPVSQRTSQELLSNVFIICRYFLVNKIHFVGIAFRMVLFIAIKIFCTSF